MAILSYQIKIIDLYRTQEVRLAALYRMFGERFIADKAFWNRLAAEERMHAKLIDRLQLAADKGVLIFEEGKVRIESLTGMIRQVEALIQKVRKGEMNRIGALSHTVDLESALIEKDVFTHFTPRTEKARGVLQRLNAETFTHLVRVREAYDAELRDKASMPAESGTQDADKIVWTPALSVDIPHIDAQHRFLFGLINELVDLRTEAGFRDRIPDLIRRLLRFSDAHFAAEDEVMIESDFPLFLSHRSEHQQFVQHLSRFLDDYIRQRQDLGDEMMAFMRTWWLRHTGESDLKYSRWMLRREI